MKLSERSAISAVPPTRTVAPYSPWLMARVDSASREIGRDIRLAKKRAEQEGADERRGAPEKGVADHLVDGSEGEVPIPLEEDSPVRLPDRGDRGEDVARSPFSRIASPARGNA